MSSIVAGPDTSQSARRHNAVSVLFLLCAAFAFTLRATVSPQLLDYVIAYTGEGGAFYEKVHLGTYAVLLLLPFVLGQFARPLLSQFVDRHPVLTRVVLILGAIAAAAFAIQRHEVTGVSGTSGIAEIRFAASDAHFRGVSGGWDTNVHARGTIHAQAGMQRAAILVRAHADIFQRRAR